MNASDSQIPRASAAGQLRAKSGWIIVLGAIYVLSGLIALSSVTLASVVSVFVVGIMMVVAGTAEVINAFLVKSSGKFLLWMVLGGLYIVAGVLTFENPRLTAALLTFMLGASLIASGIMKVMLAFDTKAGASRLWGILSGLMLWMTLSGVITVLVGFVIVSHWPGESLFVLGIFLGADLVFTGVGWISLGLGVKSRT
jgi:uncharacterized membrane protein HdeD (DUF308 family)